MKIIIKFLFLSILFLTKYSNSSEFFSSIGESFIKKIEGIIPLIRKATEDKPNLKEINIFLNVNVVESKNTQTTKINEESENKMSDHYNKGKGALEKGFVSLSDYVSQNKKKVCYALAFSTYSLIHLRLWYLKYKLNDSNCWSLWNKEASLQELFEMQQSKFSKNLLKDAHRKYATVDNLTNFSKPFMHLMQDLEQEKNYLTQYQKIINVIEKLYLKKLFFYDESFISKISERLDRIAYIKNTFLNWLSEYKLNNAKEFLDK